MPKDTRTAMHLSVPIEHNGVAVPVECHVTLYLDDATVMGMPVPEHVRGLLYIALEGRLLSSYGRDEY